jgi:hypothetical protein
MQKSVRYTLILLFCLSASFAGAQTVAGIITDKATQQPIIGATVRLGKLTTQTNRNGLFEIDAPHLDDTLAVSYVGYLNYSVFVTKNNTSLHIQLESKATALQSVTIYGTRDFKPDSIANRTEFAKQFNYTPPKVKDAFGINPGIQGLYPGIFLSIDLLTLVKALTAKSSSDYKFKQSLIKDEHEQYVDEHFNRGAVSRITGLKDDTLSAFLVQYRPPYAFVLKATPYDIEVYIKASYKKFKKDGMPLDNALVKEN